MILRLFSSRKNKVFKLHKKPFSEQQSDLFGTIDDLVNSNKKFENEGLLRLVYKGNDYAVYELSKAGYVLYTPIRSDGIYIGHNFGTDAIKFIIKEVPLELYGDYVNLAREKFGADKVDNCMIYLDDESVIYYRNLLNDVNSGKVPVGTNIEFENSLKELMK